MLVEEHSFGCMASVWTVAGNLVAEADHTVHPLPELAGDELWTGLRRQRHTGLTPVVLSVFSLCPSLSDVQLHRTGGDEEDLFRRGAILLPRRGLGEAKASAKCLVFRSA